MDPETLVEALIRGDAQGCARLAQEGLDSGLSPQILLDGLMAGMAVIGDRFKCNEVFIPEVLIAARAMKAGLAVLRPRLAETGVSPVGNVVMGTVKGDLHDIGKNVVCMMLEGAGFHVTDLGVDVAPERFVQAIEKHGCQVLGMSALLTTTMLRMRETIEALKAAGFREKIRVMVGGAPVTRRFADEIGADGYAEDAVSAVEKARELLAGH